MQLAQVGSKRRRKNNQKHPKAKNLKILYSNANGRLGKLTSLKSAMEEQETSIALVAETKLESTPPNITEYKWIQKRKKRRRGSDNLP